MARLINRLTAKDVTKITKPGAHADGGGLYLLVDDNRRYWFFRYVKNGREQRLGIGPVHTWNLAEARMRARELRQMISSGRDPLAEKRTAEASQAVLAAKGAMTFDECAAKYIATHESSWSHPKHRAQWVGSLKNYVSDVIGNLPVASIDRGHVLKVLDPEGLWLSKTETMSRVRNRIEAILGWATAAGYREGENPAAWSIMKHLLAAPDATKRARTRNYPALPYREIGQFMTELRAKEGVAARGLEFLILTAARTDEVLGAAWPEFDLGEKVWTVPPERMKNRLEHRVPLTPAAIAVIEQMQALRHDDRVFPISRIDIVLKSMRPAGTATVHGFRATFKTWSDEKTDFERRLVEKCLAHTVGDEAERAYQRGDLLTKRGKIMLAWANYCARPAVTATSNVTPLRKKIAGSS